MFLLVFYFPVGKFSVLFFSLASGLGLVESRDNRTFVNPRRRRGSGSCDICGVFEHLVRDMDIN